MKTEWKLLIDILFIMARKEKQHSTELAGLLGKLIDELNKEVR